MTIPENWTEIKMTAFYACSDLVSVTITGGVKTIKDGAFAQVSFKKVIMYDNVTEIFSHAFADNHAFEISDIQSEAYQNMKFYAFSHIPYV